MELPAAEKGVFATALSEWSDRMYGCHELWQRLAAAVGGGGIEGNQQEIQLGLTKDVATMEHKLRSVNEFGYS